MSSSGSGKKNVTGVGKALGAFLKAHKINISALARALSEVDPTSDVETCRRAVQRWLKGPSLRGASVRKLDEAFQFLKVPRSFDDFLAGYSQPPPLPHPVPEDFEDWVWLARHDYTYIQGHGIGETDWDDEVGGPVHYRPSAAELNAAAKQLARKVWTFFKRVNYRWERDDCLDRLYRCWYRQLFEELQYRRFFLLEDIEYESFEDSATLAAWLACKEFSKVAGDPDWEAPPPLSETPVEHDEMLLRAERRGPLYDGFSFNSGWPGRWIELGAGINGLFSDDP